MSGGDRMGGNDPMGGGDPIGCSDPMGGSDVIGRRDSVVAAAIPCMATIPWVAVNPWVVALVAVATPRAASVSWRRRLHGRRRFHGRQQPHCPFLGARHRTTPAPDFAPLRVDLPVDLQERLPELTRLHDRSFDDPLGDLSDRKQVDDLGTDPLLRFLWPSAAGRSGSGPVDLLATGLGRQQDLRMRGRQNGSALDDHS